MSDDAENFVRYREHVATRDEIRAKLQELELQTARLQASLLHLPDKVDELTRAVNALLTQKRETPQVDTTALAMHRAMDELSKRSGGNFERWLLLAMVGGVGWMAARFFIGG